ncbi:MAG: hypothetical protein CM15mP74_28460 [Halieaceae bacterium]|nr:MAG: hypothetical protein CM15mP74_28460 [Halieaceae bacterium]
MFSPFLRKPFEKAREAGLIPEHLDTIAGTWGALYDTGDLTYLTLCTCWAMTAPTPMTSHAARWKVASRP